MREMRHGRLPVVAWIVVASAGLAVLDAGPRASEIQKRQAKQDDADKSKKSDKSDKSDAEKAPAKPRERGPAWKKLDKGLVVVRQKGRPALVLWPAPQAADDDFVTKLVGYLETSTIKRTAKNFELVALDEKIVAKPWPARPAPKSSLGAGSRTRRGGRVGAEPTTSADSPSARERFRLRPDVSELLVLSFREEVVERFRGELPSKAEFRKKLARVASVNRIFYREDQRVGALLEKSLYAFENGKRKAAVAAVRDLENPKAQRRMDDGLKKRVEELLGKYRGVAREQMDKADLLDRQLKFQKALELYETVRRDFPLVDINKRATTRIGEIWRKIQMATGRTSP